MTNKEIAREIVEEFYHFPEDESVDCVPKSLAGYIERALNEKDAAITLPSREEVETALNESFDSLERTYDFGEFYDWLRDNMVSKDSSKVSISKHTNTERPEPRSPDAIELCTYTEGPIKIETRPGAKAVKVFRPKLSEALVKSDPPNRAPALPKRPDSNCNHKFDDDDCCVRCLKMVGDL